MALPREFACGQRGQPVTNLYMTAGMGCPEICPCTALWDSKQTQQNILLILRQAVCAACRQIPWQLYLNHHMAADPGGSAITGSRLSEACNPDRRSPHVQDCMQYVHGIMPSWLASVAACSSLGLLGEGTHLDNVLQELAAGKGGGLGLQSELVIQRWGECRLLPQGGQIGLVASQQGCHDIGLHICACHQEKISAKKPKARQPENRASNAIAPCKRGLICHYRARTCSQQVGAVVSAARCMTLRASFLCKTHTGSSRSKH